MPRRPAVVTQADVARTLRAVQATGMRARIEVYPDGRIVIVPAEATAVQIPSPAADTGREIIL